MKMLIKEFAEFTGVSVRTLHYYDEIGYKQGIKRTETLAYTQKRAVGAIDFGH